MSNQWSIPVGSNVETLQQTVKGLSQLMQVNLVLSSTLALEPLLQVIMEAATEITHSQAASILLLDRRTRELRFAASTGSDAETLKDVIVPLEGSIAGAIVTEGRAILIEDTAQMQFYAHCLGTPQTIPAEFLDDEFMKGVSQEEFFGNPWDYYYNKYLNSHNKEK